MIKFFVEQPKYIQSIVGYSAVTGRTYFRDKRGTAYLSSWDGVRMDVVNPAKMRDIMSADSFLPAVNIPGYEIGVIDTVMDISWPGSDYSGMREW